MATLFQDGDRAVTPNFFSDSFQPDDSTLALFDDAPFGSLDEAFKVSTAEAYQLGILPTAPSKPSASSYAYPALDFSTGPDPYGGRPVGPAAAGPTPPASAENSPASWPLDDDDDDDDDEADADTLAPLGAARRPRGRGKQLPLPALGAPRFGSGAPISPPDDGPLDLDFGAPLAAPSPPRQHAEPTRSAARSRKAKATSAATPPPASSASKSSRPARRGRAGRRAQPTISPATDAPTELSAAAAAAPVDPKRSLFLERNRVAAFKCRQKKKEQVARMEADCRDMARRKGERLLELKELHREYFRLKSLLLEHARTGCGRAQGHLRQLLEDDLRRGDAEREMLEMLRAADAAAAAGDDGGEEGDMDVAEGGEGAAEDEDEDVKDGGEALLMDLA